MADQECCLCGAPMPWPDYDPDSDACTFECMRVFGALDDAGFPVSLGHAIRRFVRRAEVAALRNDVLGSAHQWKAGWRRPDDDDRRAVAWGRLLAALDRLAALAIEGAGR